MRLAACIIIAVVIIGGLGFMLIPTQVLTSQHRSWVDAISGSMKYETVSALGHSSGEQIEPSPLEVRLREADIAWTPEWRFLHNTRRNVTGRAISYECGMAPPIYSFRVVLREFAEASSDQQLRDFVRILQFASEDEQRKAVELAADQVFRTMAAPPGEK